jgi:hypothetical protein
MATGAVACGSDEPEDGADVAEAAMPETGAPASMHDWMDAAPSKLWTSDGNRNSFGSAVAIDGDLAVVGAPFDRDKGRTAGAAYIFERCGDTWVQKAKVYPDLGPDALAGDAPLDPPDDPPPLAEFGTAVAIDGKTVVIGAPYEASTSRLAGAAYVFQLRGGQWLLKAKLHGSDEASFDHFGAAVAIEDDTVAVGSPSHAHDGTASGAVYLFERHGQTWTPKGEIRPADPTGDDGFGASVALDGKRLVAGAPNHALAGVHEGAAYVYKRSGHAWAQEALLVPDDGAASDAFGASVGIDGKRVVVGSPYNDENALTTDAGAAYVFRREGHCYSQQAKLVAADASPNAYLGNSVAIDGRTILAGAPSAGDTGAAYVFGYCHGDWTQRAKLVAADLNTYDEFGFSVALDDDVALVGAPGADGLVSDTGAVYAFTPDDGDDDLQGNSQRRKAHGQVGAARPYATVETWASGT